MLASYFPTPIEPRDGEAIPAPDHSRAAAHYAALAAEVKLDHYAEPEVEPLTDRQAMLGDYSYCLMHQMRRGEISPQEAVDAFDHFKVEFGFGDQ